MKTAEETLRNAITESGLYFDNNGNRLVLVSKSIAAINEARKEAIEECAKIVGSFPGNGPVDNKSILLLLKELK